MITLALMKPGRSGSGRRYFRGNDKRGNVYWLLEDPGSQATRWILKVDAGGSAAAEERPHMLADESRAALPAPGEGAAP